MSPHDHVHTYCHALFLCLTYYLFLVLSDMSKTFFNMPNNITSKAPVVISFQNSSSLPWATDRPEALREGGDSPPPAKRARSSERDSFPDRERSPARNNNGEMSESLLGQALEGGPNISLKEVRHSLIFFLNTIYFCKLSISEKQYVGITQPSPIHL